MKLERALSIALLALLAVWSIVALTLLVEPAFGEYVDSAIYLLTAQSLAAGQGYTYLDHAFFVRPPGLSWLLQPLVAAPLDHEALNRFMAACAVAAFAGVALALRRLHGALIGTLLALLFAISRLSVQSFNKLFAEFPFMALFFGALWLLMPAKGETRVGWRRGLLGAVLLSASCYLRTVGLLALPGLALTGLFRQDGRRWQGPTLAALALALHLPWMVWARDAAQHAERPATQTLMFDYATALLHTDPGDPGSPLVDAAGWMTRLADNSVAIANSLGGSLIGVESGPLPWIVTAAVAAALLAALVWRHSLLDWYGLAYIVMLLAYFTYADRLLLPLLPVLLSALFFLVERLAERLAARAARPQYVRPAAFGATALLLALVAAGHWSADLAPPDFKQQNAVTDGAAAAWLVEHTSPDARLLHERGPILGILTGRRAYTYRNLPGGWPGGPPVDWIVLGPRPAAIEAAVAQAALEQVELPVRWRQQKQPLVVRLYRMTAPR